MYSTIIPLLLSLSLLPVIFCDDVTLSPGTVYVSVVGAERCSLAEGPHWDHMNEQLYLVDITRACVLRYVPKEDRYYRAKVPYVDHVGFIIPVDRYADLFVIGADNKILLIQWNGRSDTVRIRKELLQLELQGGGGGGEHRFNDAKADVRGRLIAGTMLVSADQSRRDLLISLDSNLSMQKLLTNVSLSNGIAWNTELGKMYHCDSLHNTVTQYDYDDVTGRISNPVVVIDATDPKYGFNKDAVCDGMTIDTQGDIYIAMNRASQILHVDPRTRELVHRVPVPTAQVTSLSWGGPHLDVLYVTTGAEASEGGDEGRPNTDNNAGRVYRVEGLGRTGRRANKYKLDRSVVMTRQTG